MNLSFDLAYVFRFEHYQTSTGWNLFINPFPGSPFGNLRVYLIQLPEGIVTQCLLLKAEGLPATITAIGVTDGGINGQGADQFEVVSYHDGSAIQVAPGM